MNYDLTLLENAVKEFKITLSEEQKAQLFQYYELLIEWNKVMNLTGITEFDEVLQKHFADSLSVVRALDMSKLRAVLMSEQGRISWNSIKNCVSSSESNSAGFLK